MTEPVHRIETEAADGRGFTIVEYASFRWEQDGSGDRHPVRNAATYFETACGLAAVPGPEPLSFVLPQLGLTVYTLLDADTGERLALPHGPSVARG